MKSSMLNLKFALVLAGLVAFSSCKKEVVEPILDQSKTFTTPQEEVAQISQEVDAEYLSVEFFGGNENETFFVTNEGLTDVYLLESSSFDATERSRPAQLIGCLKAQKLDERQIAGVRKALAAYEECKAVSVKRHRAAYAELHKKMEGARKDLATKLRNKEISKEEFQKAMRALQERFNNAMKEIKSNHAAALKACFEKFMTNLKDILTEEQWKAFIGCVSRK